MRSCLFCGSGLSAGKRAKEHVLRNSWLKRLGLAKALMEATKATKAGVISRTVLAADQMQAGEVCASCNNGWMDHLDREIEKIVLALASHIRTSETTIQFTRDEARLLGRWLLKVAAAHEYTDSKDRRHMPREIRKQLRARGYLPPGFMAFYMTTDRASEGIDIVSLDAWPSDCIHLLPSVQRMRKKFAIRYHNVIFGFCYILSGRPVFRIVPGFHQPLITSRSGIEYIDPAKRMKYLDAFNEVFGAKCTVPERALASIGISEVRHL